MITNFQACSGCGRAIPAIIGQPVCPDCYRRSRWGIIIDDLLQWFDVADAEGASCQPALQNALEAVADLMSERRRMEIRLRKEVEIAIRAGQRDAARAYSEGLSEGAEGEHQ